MKENKKEVKTARPGKYDITVKLDMTFEEAMKKAVNTAPKRNDKVKRKGK